ncbi:pilus assembly PilX N-terminal domain-containing protein [Fervidicola ferrireducens]|uniref:pilus assembly PilX N-terminal domain-containing protein n=1 Tax=Fervidicola ferrireducens TaxID=520764 RepID=UPI001656F59C|nr:pilus assembly PilX N-terminal domain-containing protein [Fervidicola ferrireducens]
MREVKRSEGGQAFILVMLVLAVVAILGSATLTLTASHRQTAAKQRDRLQAYYAADAGIERALAIIKRNPTNFWSEFPLKGISYAGEGGRIESVTVERIPGGPGTVVKITSVGKFNNARKVIVAKVRIYRSKSPAELLKGISILPKERDSDINLSKDISIIGSQDPRPVIYINGNLNLGGKSEIKNFDIYVSGEITIDKDAELINCQTTENYEAIPFFPELNVKWYEERATTFPSNNSKEGKGKKDEDIAEYKGIYFVKGNVEISGTYSGQAVIVATGKIDVPDDLKAYNPNEDLLVLISLGGQVNIDKRGSDSTVDALIISDGILSCKNKVVINGGILVRQIEYVNKLTINCNPALVERHSGLMELAFGGSGGGSTRIEIESWSER